MATNPPRNSRPDSSGRAIVRSTSAQPVVPRFPPDPTEPRFGKRFAAMPLLTVLGPAGLHRYSIFRDAPARAIRQMDVW